MDDEIELVLENPKIDQEKKGDIKGIYVHKFSMINTQYLLSYRFNEDELELITIGPHENYYRDLKTYLKSR